jgi:hypothetical protein
LIEKIGAKPVWNTPKDTVMYPPLPINFSVGSSNGQVYGLNIADTASDMSRLPGLKVEYQEKTKLVKSLH